MNAFWLIVVCVLLLLAVYLLLAALVGKWIKCRAGNTPPKPRPYDQDRHNVAGGRVGK